MLPRISQCILARQTPRQVDSNGWRRRISKTDGGILQGNRNSSRSDSVLYIRTKRHCRASKQNDLRKDSCYPHGHRSPEGTVGRACTDRRSRQKSQPHTGTQEQDSLQGFIWRKARRLVPCCNWHKSICAHSQEENMKVGSPGRTRSRYLGMCASWEKQQEI